MPNHTPEQLAKALAMALTTERGPRLLRDYAAAWDALHPNEQPPWVVVERPTAEALAHEFGRALTQWAGLSRGANEPPIHAAKDLEAHAFRYSEMALSWLRAALGGANDA